MNIATVMEGPIPSKGMVGVLIKLEKLGLTGVLTFQSGEIRGIVQVVQGRVMESGAQPVNAVELLMSLLEGKFAVYPKLPHLPVSRGTDTMRQGSLAVHPPSELIKYCETAALTGRLRIDYEKRVAIGYYERGRLVDIVIDHEKAEDWGEILRWQEGLFEIALASSDNSQVASLREQEKIRHMRLRV